MNEDTIKSYIAEINAPFIASKSRNGFKLIEEIQLNGSLLYSMEKEYSKVCSIFDQFAKKYLSPESLQSLSVYPEAYLGIFRECYGSTRVFSYKGYVLISIHQLYQQSHILYVPEKPKKLLAFTNLPEQRIIDQGVYLITVFNRQKSKKYIPCFPLSRNELKTEVQVYCRGDFWELPVMPANSFSKFIHLQQQNKYLSRFGLGSTSCDVTLPINLEWRNGNMEVIDSKFYRSNEKKSLRYMIILIVKYIVSQLPTHQKDFFYRGRKIENRFIQRLNHAVRLDKYSAQRALAFQSVYSTLFQYNCTIDELLFNNSKYRSRFDNFLINEGLYDFFNEKIEKFTKNYSVLWREYGFKGIKKSRHLYCLRRHQEVVEPIFARCNERAIINFILEMQESSENFVLEKRHLNFLKQTTLELDLPSLRVISRLGKEQLPANRNQDRYFADLLFANRTCLSTGLSFSFPENLKKDYGVTGRHLGIHHSQRPRFSKNSPLSKKVIKRKRLEFQHKINNSLNFRDFLHFVEHSLPGSTDITQVRTTLAELFFNNIAWHQNIIRLNQLITTAKTEIVLSQERINPEKFKNKYNIFDITPILGKRLEVGGIEITQLVTEGELRQEGAEMNHCVSNYFREVIHGYSLIFSLRSQDSRSTLEIHPPLNDSSFSIIQHQSFANRMPDEEHLVAGKLLLNMLNERYTFCDWEQFQREAYWAADLDDKINFTPLPLETLKHIIGLFPRLTLMRKILNKI